VDIGIECIVLRLEHSRSVLGVSAHATPRSPRCSQLCGSRNEGPDELGVYHIWVDILTGVDIQWLVVGHLPIHYARRAIVLACCRGSDRTNLA